MVVGVVIEDRKFVGVRDDDRSVALVGFRNSETAVLLVVSSARKTEFSNVEIRGQIIIYMRKRYK